MVLAKKLRERIVWWLVFLSALSPLLYLIYATVTQQLGADPAKKIVLETGDWALILLWASLAITPVRKLLSWNWLIKYRRMIGLYCFFYVVLHFLAFTTFILGWELEYLVIEVTQRPYAIVGFIAFLLLMPLAITSTKVMQKKLKKNWVKLHRIIYLIGVLSLIHIIWQIRSDYLESISYGALLLWMLGYRFYKSKYFESKLKNYKN